MVQKDASAIQEISDKDLLRVSRLNNGDPEIFQSIQGEGDNVNENIEDMNDDNKKEDVNTEVIEEVNNELDKDLNEKLFLLFV